MSSAAKAEPEVAVSEQTPNPNQTESLDNAKSKVDAHDVNTYCPGLKIEAKDFDGKWYPAKITDIDWTENEILVHFENWSTKFDEWIQMDSSRLRHLPKDPPAPVTFAKGEEVMAQWNANQKYPGTIQAVRSNGRYDVLFHDGFLKSGLPGIKIAKIDSENIRNDIKNFTDIGTKEERRERKRKINVAELFHINKRSKKKGLVHSKSPDVKTYPVNRSRIKKTLPATGETEVIDADMETAPSEPTTPQQPEAKPNATTTPVSTSKNLVETSPLSVEVKYHDGRTETWSKQLYQRSEGRTAGKFDIIIMNPQGKKFRSRNEIMKYCEENGIVYTHEAFDFSAKGRPKSKPIVQTTLVNSEPVQTEAMEKPPPPKKPRRKSQQEESIPVIPALPQPPAYLPQLLPVESPALDEGKIFIGDIEVKTDNGKLICPVKECSKHFRRENLLHMHMKHYHPEFSKFLDYTPSVTDLAYARTVGNMEPIEGPQQASRKSFTVEKTEKTPTKIENSRRTIGSVSEIKEVKKAAAKLTETKIDAKLNVNIAPVASTSTVEEVPDLNISSPAKEAFEAYENTLQTTPTAQAAQDNRLPTVEESQFEQVQEVAEQPLPLPNETKTLKHSTHRRRKPARFQGSFSDQIRRRKYNMHDNRRSNYKIGKKEPQTPVPQTSVPSPLAMEDLSNSNTSSQAFSMARYPKQQSIVSNEISGKNHLLTNSRTLAPSAKRKRRRKHYSVLQEKNKLVIKIVQNEPKDDLDQKTSISIDKPSDNNENKEISNGQIKRKRSFLAGLLNARRMRALKKNGILRSKKEPKKKLKKKKHPLHTGYSWAFDAEYNLKAAGESSKSDCSSNLIKTEIKSEDTRTLQNIDAKCSEDVNSNFSDAKHLTRENLRHFSSKIEPKNSDLKSDSDVDIENLRDGEDVKNILNEHDDKKVSMKNETDACKKNSRKEASLPKIERDLTKAYVALEDVIENKHYFNDKNERKRQLGNRKNNVEKDKRKLNQRKRVRFHKTIKEKYIHSSETEDVEDESYSGLSVRNEYFRKWNYTQELEDEEVQEQNEDDKLKFKKHEELKLFKKKPKNYMVNYLNKKCRKGDQEDSSFEKDDKNVSKIDLSSGIDYTQGTEDSKSPLAVDNEKVEKLRRNEIINCVCGVTEEDGLMIQCDLCLCWQHGHCSSILIDSDVPDKYICSICKNPFRGRPSMKYIHDQEWLKEGTLPSLSFRSKREEIINSRKAVLKRSHDLSGSISLLSQVIHSLRVKLNIAEKKDHPKLWLWAKKWSEKKPSRLKENDIEIKEEKLGEANGDIKLEGSLVHKEQLIPKAPEPEAPIDSAECRLNLLDHLIHYQTLVDARLSCIESLVAELESMQEDAVDDETPEEYPRTKATVRMLLRDLNTMKKIAAIS